VIKYRAVTVTLYYNTAALQTAGAARSTHKNRARPPRGSPTSAAYTLSAARIIGPQSILAASVDTTLNTSAKHANPWRDTFGKPHK